MPYTSCVFYRYQKEVEELLERNPDFIKPESRLNEVMGWVTSGLKDFSLSRSKVEWGIRVPWDPSQTFYVWTDALMGCPGFSGRSCHACWPAVAQTPGRHGLCVSARASECSNTMRTVARRHGSWALKQSAFAETRSPCLCCVCYCCWSSSIDGAENS